MEKQEIKRGFEWYKMLTKKQQKRFRVNCHKEKSIKYTQHFQKTLNSNNNFRSFIYGSFVFYESKEGSDYWFDLVNRKYFQLCR